MKLSYPAEIFAYHGEQMRQAHKTQNRKNNGYDTERTEHLALSFLYSFDPYDIQDDRQTNAPEYIGGQNEYNNPFQNSISLVHFLILLSGPINYLTMYMP